MKEVKMKNNLRKCHLYLSDTIHYFHTWTTEGAVKVHPEDPCKDHVYSRTMAIIEDSDTGEVIVVHPDNLTFMNDEGGQDA